MSNPYTSTELLASLKRRGFIPSSTNFTAADFFKIVDDETQTYIVPLLMSVREEYLVQTDELAIGDYTGDGETDLDYPNAVLFEPINEVRIPERAIGGKLRDVAFGVGGENYTQMLRLEPSAIYEYTSAASSTISGIPRSYYIRGNKIVLLGTPALSDKVRVSYYQRPNRVVPESEVALIASEDDIVINGGVYDYTPTGTLPTAFGAAPIIDVVKSTPGFDTLAKDVSATADGSVVSISWTDYPEITDSYMFGPNTYICLAGETPIPQIPVDLHPLLAQRVTATCLHALGDQKAEAAYAVADKMEARILKLITPRAEGTNRVIQNRYGVGRGSRSRRY